MMRKCTWNTHIKFKFFVVVLVFLVSIIGCRQREASDRASGSLSTECPDHCERCYSSTTCERCIRGYFLSHDHSRCQKCLKGCQVCSDESHCKECLPRYSLVGWICERCTDDHCKECDPINVCKRCSRGFTVSSTNKCVGTKYRFLSLILIVLLFFLCLSVALLSKMCEQTIDDNSDSEDDMNNQVFRRYSNILHEIKDNPLKSPGELTYKGIGRKDIFYRKHEVATCNQGNKLRSGFIERVSNNKALSSVSANTESDQPALSNERIQNLDQSSIRSFLGSDTNPFESSPERFTE